MESRRIVESVDAGADGKYNVHFSGGHKSGGFDLVIDALGVKSCLAPRGDKTLAYGALWANIPFDENDGFKSDALEQRYRKASEMAGVLPIGAAPDGSGQSAAFFWSLKHEDYAAWRTEGLDAWKDSVLALWPQIASLLEAITHPDDLVMAQYAHHTLRNPVSDNVVHIGDSYHAASPQLGQGANMALLDAWALVKAIRDKENLETALEQYAASRRWHVRALSNHELAVHAGLSIGRNHLAIPARCDRSPTIAHSASAISLGLYGCGHTGRTDETSGIELTKPPLSPAACAYEVQAQSSEDGSIAASLQPAHLHRCMRSPAQGLTAWAVSDAQLHPYRQRGY